MLDLTKKPRHAEKDDATTMKHPPNTIYRCQVMQPLPLRATCDIYNTIADESQVTDSKKEGSRHTETHGVKKMKTYRQTTTARRLAQRIPLNSAHQTYSIFCDKFKQTKSETIRNISDFNSYCVSNNVTKLTFDSGEVDNAFAGMSIQQRLVFSRFIIHTGGRRIMFVNDAGYMCINDILSVKLDKSTPTDKICFIFTCGATGKSGLRRRYRIRAE